MNANKQDAGGEVTNPDNVVGLDDVLTKWRAWLPLIGPDVARRVLETCIMDVGKLCRAAPAGMVLVPREIVANYRESTHIPRHRRICDSALAAPAGGDVNQWFVDALSACGESVPLDAAPAGSGEVTQFLMEVACKAEALANRWRDDAKGFRERDMILAADNAEFYAEELEAILPREEGGAAGGIYGPLSGDKEASMRGYCMTQLAAVEDEYPDTGKFIRDWLTHVEKDRNRLFHALLRKLQQGADYVMVPRVPTDEMETAHRMYGDTSDWWQAVIAASQGQEGGNG